MWCLAKYSLSKMFPQSFKHYGVKRGNVNGSSPDGGTRDCHGNVVFRLNLNPLGKLRSLYQVITLGKSMFITNVNYVSL